MDALERKRQNHARDLPSVNFFSKIGNSKENGHFELKIQFSPWI